ncbi:hypothetical protein [Streptomyces sp. NP-1717]|uniref:hypothetical protein n=1 Tax=Streptomyces sp. NP-1717 TaxID=2704470 RepID=UPI001F5C33B9|nr:hypothetical protein [Streptomyces sp. NP-1717]MCI3221567.1 hypothetical protein [Streptomyces sp. NP-1717]
MPSPTTAPDTTAPPPVPAPDQAATRRMLLGPMVIGLFLVLAFAGLMIPALQDPKPHDVPIGVVGPAGTGDKIDQQLQAASPDAFDVTSYGSEGAVRDALMDHEIYGALLFTAPQQPPTLLVAGAAGDAPARVVTAAYEELTRQAGATGKIEDVAPLPESDSRGVSGLLLSIALVIGALLFQAVLSLMAARLPARKRFLAGLGYAVIAGGVGALLAGPVIGAFDGSFPQLFGVAVLLSLAAVGVVAACQGLLGVLGVAVGALVVLPLGVSSSGGPVDYHFLPAFYSTISQYMPMGSAITSLRRIFYFDGNNVMTPLLTLAVWAAAAWIVALIAERVRPFRPAVLVVPVSQLPPGYLPDRRAGRAS